MEPLVNLRSKRSIERPVTHLTDNAIYFISTIAFTLLLLFVLLQCLVFKNCLNRFKSWPKRRRLSDDESRRESYKIDVPNDVIVPNKNALDRVGAKFSDGDARAEETVNYFPYIVGARANNGFETSPEASRGVKACSNNQHVLSQYNGSKFKQIDRRLWEINDQHINNIHGQLHLNHQGHTQKEYKCQDLGPNQNDVEINNRIHRTNGGPGFCFENKLASSKDRLVDVNKQENSHDVNKSKFKSDSENYLHIKRNENMRDLVFSNMKYDENVKRSISGNSFNDYSNNDSNKQSSNNKIASVHSSLEKKMKNKHNKNREVSSNSTTSGYIIKYKQPKKSPEQFATSYEDVLRNSNQDLEPKRSQRESRTLSVREAMKEVYSDKIAAYVNPHFRPRFMSKRDDSRKQSEDFNTRTMNDASVYYEWMINGRVKNDGNEGDQVGKENGVRSKNRQVDSSVKSITVKNGWGEDVETRKRSENDEITINHNVKESCHQISISNDILNQKANENDFLKTLDLNVFENNVKISDLSLANHNINDIKLNKPKSSKKKKVPTATLR